MIILGENYDPYFGLDEYDPYDPCEGYEDEWDNEELEAIEDLNEYNKETGEVQNGTYYNVIKGMRLEL